MTLKKRFTLIIVGALLFAVLAPTAIYFAKGYRYDFENNRFTTTGTLSVRTDPKGATLYLNDNEVKETPVNKRFLIPDEYTIRLEKPGYFVWKKTVAIHPRFVTTVPNEGQKVYLLKQGGEQEKISTTTQVVFSDNERAFMADKDTFYSISDKKAQSLFQLRNTPEQIISANLNAVIYKNNQGLHYANENAEIVIPATLTNVKLSNTGQELYAQTGQNQLVTYDPINQVSSVIRNQVFDYEIVGEEIYTVSITNDGLVLSQINVMDNRNETQITALPQSSESKIIVDQDKQIFIILDGTLYYVTDKLEKINESIEYAKWDPASSTLVYGNMHEIWTYNPAANQPNQLITRTSDILGQPLLSAEIGYLFYLKGDDLRALELSNHGAKNVYTLTQTNTEQTEILGLSKNKFLIYKDGDEIIAQTIR